MCGILGIASGTPVKDRDLPLRMRDAMSHRGPDDAGIWWSPDARVCLAHRRLAVIDLSPAGHQPMSDARGELWLTFNGEIYNFLDLRQELEQRGHLFRSSTDTEVILAAYREWGSDCLRRFDGMFAFALYDSRPRRLFLVRDRAGEKPLFYHHAGGRLVFASELKALTTDSTLVRDLDRTALNFYLTYGYVPGQHCMLRDFRKLPQGHSMTFDLDSGALTVSRYWELPNAPQGPEVDNEGELSGELERLLAESVRRRLIADVPVGIMLSGGVDSSIVAALAARVSPKPVRTFTVSFPGASSYDEGPFAGLVARHLGAEHTELVAESGTVNLLPMLARQYDEPIADSSMLPTYLISKAIRQHATVALGGDGGDELFGGYPHYCWIQRQQQLGRFIPAMGRSLVSWTASRLLPLGLKGRNHLIGFSGGVDHSVAHANVLFDCQARRRLLAGSVNRSDHRPQDSPESYKAALCRPNDTPLQQATSVDFMTYLVDDILVKVDRASMLASLEVRTPFLEPSVIEFAFGRLPDNLRATISERKVLLRRLAARLLPPELDLKRKQGFSIPLDAWLRGGWGDYVRSVLFEADPSLFNQDEIRRLWDAQQRGNSNAHRLFALVMFELWRREYKVHCS
jgi:asparagine synthase (glutamine-hydrolysing)